jgi:hypothetical protein
LPKREKGRERKKEAVIMPRETIIDNEYLTLWYYPETKIVHHQFHKFVHGEALREGFTEGARLLEKYGAQKWLSDDRKNAAFTKEDQEWKDSDWRPRVVRAGWKYWALLLPEKTIGQMSMKRIISEKYTDLGITIDFFDDPQEALKWLESQ